MKQRGVKCILHPELYKLMEKERQRFKQKGVRVTQMDVTKLLARKLNNKVGVIGYAKKAAKKSKAK